MRAPALVLLAPLLCAPAAAGDAPPPPSPPPTRELANVASFARLYGVARHFYPSDAAAALDWNRFAVHGVARVRAAGDETALRNELLRLFGPLGPGIEVASRLPSPLPAARAAGPLVAWRYLGPGLSGSAAGGPYAGKRTHRADAASTGWFRAGTSRTATVSRPGSGAPAGRQFLRLGPAPAAAGPELVPEAPPAAGEHVDLDLGSGLWARVPLALPDPDARAAPSRRRALDALTTALAAVAGPGPEPGADERLADVVVAWNVFRHFYPYFDEADVAWEAQLAPHLAEARAARTRGEQRAALRGLVAAARDGHSFVADTLDGTTRGSLPVRLATVEGRLAVAASASPEVSAGAVVTVVDGAPAAARLAALASLSSGTEWWRNVQACAELASGAVGSRVVLGIDDGTSRRDVSLAVAEAPPPVERRPQSVVALEPGTWYVDLTRAAMAELAPRMGEIAAARGVVFDLRGYPGDAGMGILPHLVTAPETDRWMHVARIVGPFGRSAGWNSFGWNLIPAKPPITGRVAFLTDGRAISYAESVLGYVADRKLGTIVGAPTAGTDGNVATFATPGGFRIGFTGMRVTRHDGKGRHHLVGVRPDVPAVPTLAGLRAGRDEVLERGLAVVRGDAAKRETR
jgi:C-terminal processing protease CtpA/Prc